MGTLYENIRARRLALGMSQGDLAQEMGYTSRSTIAKIESGENDITQSKIEAFAKALKTTPATLMGWDVGESPQKEKSPTEAEDDITFNDFTYAMHNEGKELSEAQKEALLDMARRFNQYQKDMKDKE